MKRFKRIYIEITNVCNLRCSFCSVSNRKPEFMDEKTFVHILDEIKTFSDHVYFHVKGEPLLHPLIDRFLDISHEKGIKVSIATNGVLTGEKRDMLLSKPAIRQVSFSLHSLEQQKIAGKEEQYLNDIFSFALDAVAQTDMFIEFKLWNINRDSVNEVNRFILDQMEEHLHLPRKIQEDITSGKGIRLLNKIYLSRGAEFIWPDLNSPENSTRGFCYGLKRQIAILVDGTVVPCCLDGEGVVNLGNIHDSSFYDIVFSERAKRITSGFSQRIIVEELCQKCTYRDRFDL